MEKKRMTFRALFKDQHFKGWQYFDILDVLAPRSDFDIDTVCQDTGLGDRNGKKIFDGHIVRVFDEERYCVCDEWEDCEAPDDTGCREHGEHKHERPEDCEKFICKQLIKWSYGSGYFCDEDTGDFCPPLGSDEIQMEIIGDIFFNPELLK